MNFKSILLYTFIGFFVVIQFFQIDKTPQTFDSKLAFQNVDQVPAEVLTLLQSACYDCHSFETEFPWYANIQPVGWWLRSHVRGAQMNMNFSEWGKYSAEDREELLEEAAEEIEEDEMPPSSFRLMHPEAKLTEEQKSVLMSWLNND